MAKVITFSTTFQKKHPRSGEPTWFVERILNQLQDFSFVTNELAESQGFLLGKDSYIENRIKIGFKKSHTIRAGHRFKVGDKFSPRIWSGKPYQSKQIIIAPDIEVKKVYGFSCDTMDYWLHNGEINYQLSLDEVKNVAANDGLSVEDFERWFDAKEFDGQIICWNDKVNY